ncbi:MAG: hypothetical protein ACTHK8_02120 [Ginsengibacter sp.]
MKKRIETWQEAFEAKGLDPEKMPDVSMIPQEYQKPVIAQYKLNVVADVLNEGWEPDYTDWNQPKYFPWFEVVANKEKRSGSALSYLGCVSWLTVTFCGVRLSYRDRETAAYAGRQFTQLYQDLYLKD